MVSSVILSLVILSYLYVGYVLYRRNKKRKLTTDECIYGMCLLVISPITLVVFGILRIAKKLKS